MKLPWMKKEGSDTEVEVSLPDDVQKKLDASATAAAELPAIKEKLGALDKINQFIDTFKAEQDEEKKKKNQQQQQQQQQQNQQTLEEQVEALMLEGKTTEAVRLATSGQVTAIKAVHADNVRREVFEDTSKFPYYHGDIKREIDALIAGQVVDFRLNPQNIENCYHTVVGKHTAEIQEGKVKTRFAGSESGSRGTSSGSAGDSGTAASAEARRSKLESDKEVQKAARLTGIDVKDYAKMLEEDGVEV